VRKVTGEFGGTCGCASGYAIMWRRLSEFRDRASVDLGLRNTTDACAFRLSPKRRSWRDLGSSDRRVRHGSVRRLKMEPLARLSPYPAMRLASAKHRDDHCDNNVRE
jgi:hypothetical protein